MEKYDNSFALFVADKKTDKYPDFTGTGLINGVEVRVAAWNKVSAGGKKYLSGRIEFPKQEEKKVEPEVEPDVEPQVSSDLDDEIPF